MATWVKLLVAHPMLLMVGIGLLGAICLRLSLTQRYRDQMLLPAARKRIGLALVAAVGGVLVLFSIIFSTSWFFLDHAEPAIMCLSWLFVTGQPIYHPVDDAARYSHIYGPMLFVLYGWAMKLLGPSIPAAKIFASLCVLGSVVVTVAALRRHGRGAALFGLVYLLVAYALFGDKLVWVRADAILLLSVATALIGATRASRLPAIVLCAIPLGIALNIKVHSGFYFVPIFLLLLHRCGFVATAIASVMAVGVAIVPFVIFENVELGLYLAWLGMATSHGLMLEIFVRNVETAIFFIVPLLATWGLWFLNDSQAAVLWLRRQQWILLGLAVSVVVITTVASKAGAGPWHLLPFAPSCAWLLADLYAQLVLSGSLQRRNGVAASICQGVMAGFLVAGMMGLTQHVNAIRRIHQFPDRAVVRELQGILADQAGKRIGMAPGSSGDYQLVWFRPVLVTAGQPFLIDPPALMDMILAGIPTPDATTRAVGGSFYDVWVVPRQAQPFSMGSYYEPGVPMFSQAVRDEFAKAYSLKSSTEHFDVWTKIR